MGLEGRVLLFLAVTAHAMTTQLWAEAGPALSHPGYTGAARAQAWVAELGPLQAGAASGLWVARAGGVPEDPRGTFLGVEGAAALVQGPVGWLAAAGPAIGSRIYYPECGPNHRCKTVQHGVLGASARTGPWVAIGPLLLVGAGHVQVFSSEVLIGATLGLGVQFDLDDLTASEREQVP